MKSKREFGWSLCAAAMAGTVALATTNFSRPVDAAPNKSNILFFILDDVGIDQLKIFNPDSPLPPVTPNLALLAAKGIKFTKVWAMPEC
jgi:hypothetical protein